MLLRLFRIDAIILLGTPSPVTIVAPAATRTNFAPLGDIAVETDMKMIAHAIPAGVGHVVRRRRISKLDAAVAVLLEDVDDLIGCVGAGSGDAGQCRGGDGAGEGCDFYHVSAPGDVKSGFKNFGENFCVCRSTIDVTA